MSANTHNPKDLAELIDANLELPTIPVVASRALHAIDQPLTNAQSLALILQEDPGLTARILGVANSALYALPRKVGNLAQASTILGFEGLRTLVIAAAARGLYKDYGRLERVLWSHAVNTARVAQAIADKKLITYWDEAFVAGLMHDIGHVVMNNSRRARFAECLARTQREDRPLYEVEREDFGFTHTDVGALLVSRWELSPALEHAVFLHHDLELAEAVAGDACDLVYATYLANCIVHSLGLSPAVSKEAIEDAAEPALERFALSDRDLEAIKRKVKEPRAVSA